MIPWLTQTFFDNPEQTAFRLFTYVEFRTVLAILLSFFFVMALGKPTIRRLVKLKMGDNPEFDHADLNKLMSDKANTPTMGGVLICGSIFFVSALLADFSSFYVVMALVCMTMYFFIGAADDYLKMTTSQRQPGSRDGLKSWEKFVTQLGIAFVLGLFVYYHAEKKFTHELPEIVTMSRALNLPFFKSWVYDQSAAAWVPSAMLWVMPRVLFVAFAMIIIVGFSNAVNLTDGMDGLAAGTMSIVAFAFVILTVIAGYVNEYDGFILAKQLLVPHIPFSDELAVIAGAMVGACLGFLWFNCSPAQVFMGDAGSLPLGALIGFIAVVIRQEILLAIIGGIFVLEAVSVLLQVGYFKMSGGKRIFRCAPIHHHFHLAGWREQQVVIRFWLITAVLTALALASIRLR